MSEKWRSFLRGAASALDLRGALLPLPEQLGIPRCRAASPAREGWERDHSRLAADWDQVAGDFGRAFRRTRP